LKLAAEQALQLNAHQEAVGFLTKGLEILQSFSDGPERQNNELTFQAILGPALIATKGWAAPEVEEAYVRARELCEHLGKLSQLSSTLYRLATVYEYRGEFHKSQALLKLRLNLPDQPDDKELRLESQELLACSTFHQGTLHQSVGYADQGFALYDSQQHRAMTSLYGKNHGVACHLWAGLSLWFLGYPEQALKRTQNALALAQELGHLYSLASAQAQTAYLHQFRQEVEISQKFAQASISLATEHGFPYRIATGTILQGWALSAQGQPEEGITLLRQGISGYKATGAVMDLPYFLALLAEALGNNNQVEKGLEALDEAFDIILGSRTFFYEAELYRLRGTFLLKASEKKNIDDAEENFLHALDIATRQEAKMLELRTAVSIGRLWQTQNKMDNALQLLDGIYGWFVEGFGTMDLLAAKSVIEDLK
jgi:predicted ATPase